MKIVRHAFNPLRSLAVLAIAGGLLPAHAAWYDAPTVVKKIPVAQNIATNPHFINKAEDDSILLVNAQSEGDTAPTLLVDMHTLTVRQPVSKPSDGYGTAWKGGAVSAKLGLAFMGGGNSSETCAIATDGESWVKGIGLKPLSTANGYRIDGLDFSADSQYLYSNFYADSAGGKTGQGKLLRWTYNASTGVLTLDREFATSLTRVRNISVYTVNGKELVYCGEGGASSGDAKVVAIDVSDDTWTETVVASSIEELTGDITNVKLSNEDDANPVMYVLCSSGKLAVLKLASDGLSVSETLKTFNDTELHALAGGTTTAKFCSFEVTKDGKTAFIINRIDAKNANLCVLATPAYIESDGTQFVNTGYYVKPTSRIELDFAFVDFANTSAYAQSRLFDNDANNSKPSIAAAVYVGGSAGGDCSLAACIGDCDSSYNFAGVWTSNSGTGTKNAYCDSVKRTIVLDELNKRIAVAVDGAEVWHNDQSSARAFTHTATWPLGLFGRTKNAAGTNCDYLSKIRVYGFRIYEDDELVHNYVPTVKYGIAGLLDTVTGTFLYDRRTSGAGVFAYGGDIETVEDPYVESDGTDAISLGVTVSPKLKIEVDYAFTDVADPTPDGTSHYQQHLIGPSGLEPSAAVYINGSGNVSIGSGDTWSAVSTGITADTKRHTIIIDNEALDWEFTTVETTNWSYNLSADLTKTGTRPISLFGHASNDAATSFTKLSKAKVYGLKIWHGGTLVRDLAPRNIDGVAGFEDLVTGEFYTCDGLTASANAPTELSGRSGEGDAFIEADGAYFSSGSSYSIVDTRYFPSGKTKIEVDFQFVKNASSRDCLLGNYGSTYTVLVYAPNNGNFNLEAKDGTHETLALSNTVKSDTARHTAVIDAPAGHVALYDADGALQGEADFTSTWTHNNPANWPITLFGSAKDAYGKTRQNAAARIFGVKISESSDNGATYTSVHTYTPCLKGGIPGFYDEVTGEFISGGNLKAGGNVMEIDDDPYVASPEGGCYFDTGYYATSNTCVAIDYMPLEQHANQQFPFEAGARDGTHMFMRTYANGSAGDGDISYFCGNTDNISIGVPFSPNVRRVLTLDAYKLKAKVETAGKTVLEATIGAAGRVPEQSSSTLKIFSNAAMNDHCTYGRLYGFKIYEEGALVRDYAPICQGGTYALVDKVTGTVLAKASGSAAFDGSTANDSLNNSFFYAAMRDEDAYIESDGTQAINLGYYTTPNTRYEIDFQMTEVAKQARPFGQATSALSAEFYIQDSLNFNFGVGDTWTGQPTNTQADDKRHVALLDFANRECGYSGKGMYAFTAATICSKTANFPMWLFAKGTNATGSYNNRAKMRLYAFRIYEAGVLVHEYLPYKNGDTVGLYDTVTGDVKTSSVAGSNAFVYGGGMGYGKYSGANRVLLTAPENTQVRAKRSATLCAFAPGAAKYIWTKNGAVLAGATGETLSVLWTRSKVVDTYTVTPVFLVDGEEVPGTSASCTVENLPLGLLLIIK